MVNVWVSDFYLDYFEFLVIHQFHFRYYNMRRLK